MDLAKERWNRELEGWVRRMQEVGLKGIAREGARFLRGWQGRSAGEKRDEPLGRIGMGIETFYFV